jgi:transcriptional regulator with XRE-family HTH domain
MDDLLPVGEQLNILFQSVLHPERRSPYTLQEVSDATGISLGTISQLRTGRIKNPQFNTLVALSRFFNVPLRYFEARSPEECHAILAEDKQDSEPELNEIALRATRLSPEGQRDLLTVIKWIQAAEREQKPGKLPLFGLDPDLEE